MLTRTWNFFFGSGNNHAAASSSQATTKSFNERLQALQYPDSHIPQHFLCPVTLEIMEEPVMANDLQPHTFDKSSMVEWLGYGDSLDILNPDQLSRVLTARLKTDPIIDPMRTPITKLCLNAVRKQEIEEFVSSLERIDRLHKQLLNNMDVSIEGLEVAAEGTDVSREALESILAEQQREQKRVIQQVKVSLIEALQCFITLTEAVIMKEECMESEKLAEIKKINADKIALLQMLCDDIKQTNPEVLGERPPLLVNPDLAYGFTGRLILARFYTNRHYPFSPFHHSHSFFFSGTPVMPLPLSEMALAGLRRRVAIEVDDEGRIHLVRQAPEITIEEGSPSTSNSQDPDEAHKPNILTNSM